MKVNISKITNRRFSYGVFDTKKDGEILVEMVLELKEEVKALKNRIDELYIMEKDVEDKPNK